MAEADAKDCDKLKAALQFSISESRIDFVTGQNLTTSSHIVPHFHSSNVFSTARSELHFSCINSKLNFILFQTCNGEIVSLLLYHSSLKINKILSELDFVCRKRAVSNSRPACRRLF